jgi:hypothetical protein
VRGDMRIVILRLSRQSEKSTHRSEPNPPQRPHIPASKTRRLPGENTPWPAEMRCPHSGSTSSRPKPIFPTEETSIRRPNTVPSAEERHSCRPKPFFPWRKPILAARKAIPPWRNGVMEHVEHLSVNSLWKTIKRRQYPVARPWNNDRGTPEMVVA